MYDECYDKVELGELKISYEEAPQPTLEGTEESSPINASRNNAIVGRISCFSFGR